MSLEKREREAGAKRSGCVVVVVPSLRQHEQSEADARAASALAVAVAAETTATKAREATAAGTERSSKSCLADVTGEGAHTDAHMHTDARSMLENESKRGPCTTRAQTCTSTFTRAVRVAPLPLFRRSLSPTLDYGNARGDEGRAQQKEREEAMYGNELAFSIRRTANPELPSWSSVPSRSTAAAGCCCCACRQSKQGPSRCTSEQQQQQHVRERTQAV